ncbi:MAG: hypothetical protein M1138_07875 [Candidatus Thermoplasmatota archaeon]|nr:hypothetical protein [Candidatus Thermoplasmatota archaeon]
MQILQETERISWTELNLTGADLRSTMKGFLFASTLISLFAISIATMVEPVSQNRTVSGTQPSYFSATCVVWGKMQYVQEVPVSTFGYTGPGYEYASMNSTYPVTVTISPSGHSVYYDLNALNPQTSLSYTLFWPWGMSDNSGSVHVSSIYYTSTGIATRGVTWDPSFSATEFGGFGTMTTDVLIHERVFAETGSGAVTGMSETNSNIAIHWGAIAFTVVSFGITA